MDTAKITKKINGLDLNNLQIAEWEESHSSGLGAGRASEIKKYVAGPDFVVDAVEEILNEDTGFSHLFPGWHAFFGGSIGISTAQVCRWLLTKKIEGDLQGAVEALANLVDYNCGKETLITAFHGVYLDSSLKLDNGLEITPFASIPDSPNKSAVVEHLKQLVAPQSWRVEGLPSRPEEFCAVKVSHVVQPVFFPAHFSGQVTRNYDFRPLQEIGFALSLGEGLAPIEVASWSQFETNPPIPDFITTTTLFPPRQTLSFQNGNKIEGKNITDTLNQYLALDNNIRQRLHIPLERLNRASRRAESEDIAIELGVALEALLTDDQSTGENTHKIAVRGARLLAGSIDDRKGNRVLLSSIYRLRSEAVHNGKISAKKIDVPAKLDEGRDICRAILNKIVERGGHPNWSDFDVSEN